MKKINIRRYTPIDADAMESDHTGGWVPYTDYCRKVSRLKEENSRLRETIVRARMREVGMK